jgi:hypothetical protein
VADAANHQAGRFTAVTDANSRRAFQRPATPVLKTEESDPAATLLRSPPFP